ncbi:hypothetical protein NM688_g584 [Phlebia brevispora]|uniref:Uncharacterized protein n=1 Tax=Phlebia brevispora TaxID=194682 RepID=A0ACC1TDL6_9APHY|nr:hypothetical protein NM688_g584 [Phlebia brevispora]
MKLEAYDPFWWRLQAIRTSESSVNIEVPRNWRLWSGWCPRRWAGRQWEEWPDSMDDKGFDEATAFPALKPDETVFHVELTGYMRNQRGWYHIKPWPPHSSPTVADGWERNATGADVPVELFDILLKYIRLDKAHYDDDGGILMDKRELGLISLVCPRWLRILRPLIFSRITLRSGEDACTLLSLLHHPHSSIAPYIETVVLSQSLTPYPYLPWLHRTHVFDQIVGALKTEPFDHRLKMVFCGPAPTGKFTKGVCEMLPRSVPWAFIGITYLKLTDLHFKKLGDLMRILKELPSLDEFFCCNVTWEDSSSEELPPTSHYLNGQTDTAVLYELRGSTDNRAVFWFAALLAPRWRDRLDQNDAHQICRIASALWQHVDITKLGGLVATRRKDQMSIEAKSLDVDVYFKDPVARQPRRVQAIALDVRGYSEEALKYCDWEAFDLLTMAFPLDRPLIVYSYSHAHLLWFHKKVVIEKIPRSHNSSKVKYALYPSQGQDSDSMYTPVACSGDRVRAIDPSHTLRATPAKIQQVHWLLRSQADRNPAWDIVRCDSACAMVLRTSARLTSVIDQPCQLLRYATISPTELQLGNAPVAHRMVTPAALDNDQPRGVFVGLSSAGKHPSPMCVTIIASGTAIPLPALPHDGMLCTGRPAVHTATVSIDDISPIVIQTSESSVNIEVPWNWRLWSGWCPYRWEVFMDPVDGTDVDGATAFPMLKPDETIFHVGLPDYTRNQRGWYHVKRWPPRSPLADGYEHGVTGADVLVKLYDMILKYIDLEDESRMGNGAIHMSKREVGLISLVCRHWARTLQPLIFLTVTLRSSEDPRTLLSFLRHPHSSIAHYIGTVVLSQSLAQHPYVPWIHNDSVLSLVMGALRWNGHQSPLLQVDLCGPLPTGKSTKGVCEMLPGLIPWSFTGVTRLELKDLHFKKLGDLVRIPRELPSLRSFTCRNVTWEDPLSEELPPPSSYLSRRQTNEIAYYRLRGCTDNRAAFWFAALLAPRWRDRLEQGGAHQICRIASALWRHVDTSKLEDLSAVRYEDHLWFRAPTGLVKVYFTDQVARQPRRVRGVELDVSFVKEEDLECSDWATVDRFTTALPSLGTLLVCSSYRGDLLLFHKKVVVQRMPSSNGSSRLKYALRSYEGQRDICTPVACCGDKIHDIGRPVEDIRELF